MMLPCPVFLYYKTYAYSLVLSVIFFNVRSKHTYFDSNSNLKIFSVIGIVSIITTMFFNC